MYRNFAFQLFSGVNSGAAPGGPTVGGPQRRNRGSGIHITIVLPRITTRSLSETLFEGILKYIDLSEEMMTKTPKGKLKFEQLV